MPKLVINSNSINNLEITADFLDIQLSEHSSYFAGGLFSSTPQRLHFKFYGEDWPQLQLKEIKKVQYYENVEDAEPEFTGWSKYVKPANNTEEYEIIFYDVLEQVNQIDEIDIGNGDILVEEESLSPEAWLERIENRSGNFPTMDVEINTNVMQATAQLDLAVYKPTYNVTSLSDSFITNLYFAFNLNLNPLYPLISTEVYIKFNEIAGVRYLIVIKKYNHAYNENSMETTWAYGWKISIYSITDIITCTLVSSTSYWDVVGQANERWSEFLRNDGLYGNYHNSWLDQMDVGDGIYYGWLTGYYIDAGGNRIFYAAAEFPFILVADDGYLWENLNRIVAKYSGDIVLDELTLHYEKDDDDQVITECNVNYKNIIIEILKLTNSMMFAGVDGKLVIRNRLAIDSNVINIESGDYEELPEESPVDVSDNVSIPNTFLANDHPISLALIDYYKELNSALANSRKIVYFGEIKPRLNYKFKIGGVDISEKIVAVLPVNTSTENYKEVTVWQVASEHPTDERTTGGLWPDGIWDNEIIWNNRELWRNA